MAGKSVTRSIKPESLFKLPDEQKIEVDTEKRRQDALKTATAHKSKFWMKLTGGSKQKPKMFGDDPEQKKRWEEHFEKTSTQPGFFEKYSGKTMKRK